MRWLGAVLAVVLALFGVALAVPGPARAEVRWLCSPATTDDPCDGSLATTLVGADGSRRVVQPRVPADPPVDCFYVYPTVSAQTGPNATQTADPEVVSVVRQQAARFSRRCRVYVGLYRQVTLPALFAGGFTKDTRDVAYGDVREAFETYLREDNDGRGIVLLGHSQGAGVLRRLIAESFDQRAALRKRLVAAYLLGGNVLVRKGSDRGGDFDRVPLCGQDSQTGCVLAWSTFGDVPPGNTLFGRPPAGQDPLTGYAPQPGTEVACTNPASLFSNRPTELHPVLRSQPPAAGPTAAGVTALYGGPPPSADTPYVVPPDRYTAQCVRANGAHVLLLRGRAGARELHPYPDASWGLHLVDVNSALGDLVGLLGRQTRAFLRPGLDLRYSLRFRGGAACAGPPLTARVTGAVRRVYLRVRGRPVVMDATAPFTLRSGLRPGRVNRVRVRVEGTDGRTRLLTRRVRACD